MVGADLDIPSSDAVCSAFECLLMTAVPPLSWHECGTLLGILDDHVRALRLLILG